jgi:hypothetical protein
VKLELVYLLVCPGVQIILTDRNDPQPVHLNYETVREQCTVWKMPDYEPLVQSYVHLSSFPRADEALHMLKRIASLVKPIMRARGWKVRELAEFYPQQQNLLGTH